MQKKKKDRLAGVEEYIPIHLKWPFLALEAAILASPLLQEQFEVSSERRK